MKTAESITKIVHTLSNAGQIPFDQTTDLFSVGILDSLGMVEFIGLLEETFKISFSNEDLIPQNFWSIEATTKLVDKYLGAK